MVKEERAFYNYKILFKTKDGDKSITYYDVIKTLIDRPNIIEIRKRYLMPEYLNSEYSLEDDVKSFNETNGMGFVKPKYFVSNAVVKVLAEYIGEVYIPKKEHFPNDYKVHNMLLSIDFFMSSMGDIETELNAELKSKSGCFGVILILILLTLTSISNFY